MEIPAFGRRLRRRHRAALRPPRQAARDDRLARRPRPVDAGARGRPPLRTRRRRRRLRGVRLAARDRGRPGAPASPTHRCIVLIEASEESGSPDLPAHLDGAARIASARPSLVLCLDSGCLDYERLWVTTSLRGLAAGDADASTSSPRACTPARRAASCRRRSASCAQLLDRIEDSATGELLLPELHVEIPADRRAPGRGDRGARSPSAGNTHPVRAGRAADGGRRRPSSCSRRTWRPTLSITGVVGHPAGRASPATCCARTRRFQLSFRLPPTCDHAAALAAIERALTADPPYGAAVSSGRGHSGPGWNAPSFAPWLAGRARRGVDRRLRQPVAGVRRRRHDPVHGDARRHVPRGPVRHHRRARPGRNAHGPNEFLDVPTARKVTCILSHVLHAQVQHTRAAE